MMEKGKNMDREGGGRKKKETGSEMEEVKQ